MVAKKAVNKKTEQARRRRARDPVTTLAPPYPGVPVFLIENRFSISAPFNHRAAVAGVQDEGCCGAAAASA